MSYITKKREGVKSRALAILFPVPSEDRIFGNSSGVKPVSHLKMIYGQGFFRLTGEAAKN
jgi:hypothetical protein